MHYKRISAIILIFFLFVTVSPQQITANTASETVSAVNAVLVELESGRVLYEKEAHEKQRIASITKIMTAILAIESGKLDEMVTVSDRAFGTEGSSLYLKRGQKMKLEDLVYGLMLRSGNDAAVAIAEHVGGSLEGFVYLMNQKAEEIGMENSSFTNPHGLDNTENHYSTAYDMALLTRYAMKNETFKTVSSTKEHHAPNPNEKWDYEWDNKNKMLKLYEYSTGGKTGYTKLAKRTLVSTAEKDGMSLVVVTLNAGDDWNDHMKLFDMAFAEYTMTTILKNENLKKIKHSFYKNKVEIINKYNYPLSNEEKEKITLEIKLLTPRKEWKDANQVPRIVGKAIVKLDGKTIGSRNIHYQPTAETSKMSLNESWKKTFMMLVGIGKDG